LVADVDLVSGGLVIIPARLVTNSFVRRLLILDLNRLFGSPILYGNDFAVAQWEHSNILCALCYIAMKLVMFG
jgi:hypothetical protein